MQERKREVNGPPRFVVLLLLLPSLGFIAFVLHKLFVFHVRDTMFTSLDWIEQRLDAILRAESLFNVVVAGLKMVKYKFLEGDDPYPKTLVFLLFIRASRTQ